MATDKNKKDETLRARVEPGLKKRVVKYLAKPKVDLSEASFVRKAVVEFLERHERIAA